MVELGGRRTLSHPEALTLCLAAYCHLVAAGQMGAGMLLLALADPSCL